MSPTFTYVAPTQLLAVISGVGPTTGGVTVQLIGAEFAYGAAVTFGGSNATNILVQSENSITCTIPAHAAGAVNVIVTNLPVAGVDSALLTSTLVNGFTYQVQAPTVISIAPNFGFTGGGEEVVITGKAFVATPTVLFGGSAGTGVTFINSNTIAAVAPAHAAAFVDITVTNPDLQLGVLNGGYEFQATNPFVDTKGWWLSDNGFSGGTQVIVSPLTPKHPRDWPQISGFASGTAGMLGGNPAASVVFRNHIIYAGDDYVQGSNEQPTIRIFDGISDRLMNRIPNTQAGAVPKAILSMLLNNGIVYISTYDTGTTSADYAGRVFAFNPLDNSLTQLGGQTDFVNGELAYSLAWHMDRLWVGTNQSDTSAGRTAFFRPFIDTTWTFDHTFASGGVTSMRSYKGLLYVGQDAAAGTFAKVYVRSTLGVYTISDTGTGGAASQNNAFLTLTNFGDNLYSTYWNPDTPSVAKVRKFDGTSWSTVYTGTGLTIRPYILGFVDNQYIYVVGGGDALRASLIRSSDGTTWTDLTLYLAGPTNETALPIYGVVYL